MPHKPISYFLGELIVVGIATMVVGLILSYISMGEKSKEFKHWGSVALTFFLTGAIIHAGFETTGWNKWYCTNGYACS